MSEVGKIKCPACDKLVSAQMPNCPFCTQALPKQAGAAPIPEAFPMPDKDTVEAFAEFEKVKETRRQARPTFTANLPVTGPISGLISLVKPAYGGGVVMILEILLAVVALPTILIGLVSTMVGIKKWGRIPAVFVVLPAALVALVAWKMEAPVAFPVLAASLIAFSLKAIIGMTARLRQISR